MGRELGVPKLTFAHFCFPWAVAAVPGVKNLSFLSQLGVEDQQGNCAAKGDKK